MRFIYLIALAAAISVERAGIPRIRWTVKPKEKYNLTRPDLSINDRDRYDVERKARWYVKFYRGARNAIKVIDRDPLPRFSSQGLAKELKKIKDKMASKYDT